AAELVRVPEFALEPVLAQAAVDLEVVEIGLLGVRVVDDAGIPAQAALRGARESRVDIQFVLRILVGLEEIDVAGPGADVPAAVMRVVDAGLERRILRRL